MKEHTAEVVIGEQVVIAHYVIWPAEPQTWDYPGCAAEVEVEAAFWDDGQRLSAAALDQHLEAIEEGIEL